MYISSDQYHNHTSHPAHLNHCLIALCLLPEKISTAIYHQHPDHHTYLCIPMCPRVCPCPCPRIFTGEWRGVTFGCGWLGLQLGHRGAFRKGIIVHVVCLWMHER